MTMNAVRLALEPWNAPCPDAHDEREIARRTDELAAEGFDRGDNHSVKWLDDQPDEDMRELAYLAIGTSCGSRDTEDRMNREVNVLRERYVTDCAFLYREQATQEYEESRMGADDDGRE